MNREPWRRTVTVCAVCAVPIAIAGFAAAFAVACGSPGDGSPATSGGEDGGGGDAGTMDEFSVGLGHDSGGRDTGGDGAGQTVVEAGSSDGPATVPPLAPPLCQADLTAVVLVNADVSLAGDSCISVPPGTTQYDGVLSGSGTLTITAPNGPGRLVMTADSTFSLPAAQRTQTTAVTGRYVTIVTPNRPAVFVEPGATLQLGTATSDAGSIASYMVDAATEIINADNLEIDGTLALGGGPTAYLGVLRGSGAITQPAFIPGTFFMQGDNPFAGTLSIATGGNLGSLGVVFSMPNATVIFNDGSMIMNSPVTVGYTLPQTVFEDHYGDDINTDHGIITFAGVYSYSNSADQLNPSLDDPSLNTSIVTNAAASPTHANGTNASFRGINLEGGTTRWGDGKTSTFFLPSTPAPADPAAKSVKNSYINLHGGSTLVFDYDGQYTCNIGITGGGGGPNATGIVGTGNLTIAATAGNHAVLTVPQDYNGTTTIGAGATLQLGNGGPVQANAVTVGAASATAARGAITATSVVATYPGDSSLLTAHDARGAAADAIVDDGQLLVDNTTTALTLSGISGAGTVMQMGAASLTLLGNTYTGGTYLMGGAVVVGDDAALGTGSVSNDGALATATAQHRIAVGGDYTQGAAGNLTLAIAGSVQGQTYDWLQAGGAVMLGGTLTIVDVGGFAPAVGTQFVVVSAGGVLGGTFVSVASPAIKLAATYDGKTCVLTVMP